MSKRRSIAIGLLAALGALLLPAFGVAQGDTEGTVTASVDVQGTCLILSTNVIDYGVQALSTNSANTVAPADGPDITNCGSDNLDVAVSGTSATGSTANWALADTNSGQNLVCNLGSDQYGQVVAAGGGDVDLDTLPQALVAGIAPAGAVPTSASLVMPCTGSTGAGETVSFSIVFVGTGGQANLQTWYLDADGDGFGDAGNSTQAESPPSGYVADGSDCDDTDASINPGAPEVDGDGIDNNCNGQIDEGGALTTWYADSDSDGYGDPNTSTQAASQPEGYVAIGTDCDDTNASINPAAPEVDGDGIDNNCNGQIDEGGALATWYADSDADTYGNAAVSTQAVSAPPGYVADGSDCNDGDPAINPGATEILDDGIDSNCDGFDNT